MTRRRLFLTADAVGGVWPYALELARGLAPLGWDTTLALIGPAADAAQRAAVAAIPSVTLLETGLSLDWLAADATACGATGEALTALAVTASAEVTQLCQPALAAGMVLSTPLVTAVHSCAATWWDAAGGGPLPADLGWQAALTGQGLRAADAIVAPSAAFAAAIGTRYGVTPQVVRNGRTAFVLPPAPRGEFAFTAGRLWDTGKDLATLDRAAARLTFPLRAAGPLAGPHGERVAPRHVEALGRLHDVALAATLAARPVFVSAAIYEPFGLAVLEAALAGCPLVLSDIPTFRELWDGAATFVAPGDDAGFAAAITALIDHPARRTAAGTRARAHAAHYTPGAMAAGMDALYRRLLAPARVAA